MGRNALFILFVIFGFSIVSQANAQVALDATTGVRNKYTLTYVGKVVYDEPVIQGDLWFTLPKGFWADIWYSTNPKFQENFGREIDYGFGWSNKNVSAGFYYFDLMKQFSTAAIGDVTMTYVKALWPTGLGRRHQLTPYVEANYFYATQDLKANNGSYPMIGIQHDWKQAVGSVNLFQDVALVYDGGVFGSERGFIFRYQASLTAVLSKMFSVRLPYARVHTPLTSSIHDRKTEPIVGADLLVHYDFVDPPKE